MAAVHSLFLLLFSSYFQSLCEALAPGLAVSVLKAIFQEVHVQVSNVIFILLSLFHIFCVWGRSASILHQCSVAYPSAAMQCSCRTQSQHGSLQSKRQKTDEAPIWLLSPLLSAL